MCIAKKRGVSRVAVLALAGLAAGFAPPSARAAFELLSWDLVTGVDDNSGPAGSAGHFFDTVQNPFQGPGAVSNTAVGLNTARTEYDISWLLNTGSFRIDFDHHVETANSFAASLGHFLVAPDVDLRLTISASMTYTSMPADWARFIFSMYARDETTNLRLFDAWEEGGGAWFHPPSGTLSFQGDIILPANGTTYRIDYRANTDSDAFEHSGPLIDTGYFQFDLAPVPEPASALLLAGGSALALRRRRS